MDSPLIIVKSYDWCIEISLASILLPLNHCQWPVKHQRRDGRIADQTPNDEYAAEASNIPEKLQFIFLAMKMFLSLLCGTAFNH